MCASIFQNHVQQCMPLHDPPFATDRSIEGMQHHYAKTNSAASLQRAQCSNMEARCYTWKTLHMARCVRSLALHVQGCVSYNC
jgi:hypothetical protein